MSEKTSLIISNVEELTCAIDQDFDNFSGIFDQIIGHVVQSTKHTSSFISYVNSQLSNASSRRRGLTLLSASIPLCSSEIANEHATAWINNSLKYCEGEREVNPTSFRIIKPLLELCSKTPELNKTVASNILEKISEEVKSTRFDSPKAEVALECLLTCLRIYPGPCGARKIPLDKYLVTYVDSDILSPSVRLAGKCLNSLQQVGGGGTDGVNYYNNWNKQQLRLIATIHNLMDQFFASVTEMGDYTLDTDDVGPILEITQINEAKNYRKIALRTINTTVFLQEMLLGAFPVKKSILPLAILNIISRGLSVTRSALGVHVLEDIMNLTSYLVLIHKHLLELLQCLIVSLGTNLLPWGQMICKLIITTLKNILFQDAVSVEAACDLRLTCYETLRLWMTTVKSASSVNMYMDKLFPIILEDITPVKNEVNLTIQSGTPKHMSKKARKKMVQQKANNFAAARSISKILSSDSNFQPEVCISALKTLHNILNYEGSLLKITIHRQLQEFVSKTLYTIQRGDEIYPYTNEDCQIELYNILVQLTINYHFSFPPPMQFASILLTSGQSNNNARISQTCSLGLTTLNSYIHPIYPSLQLPFDEDEIIKELGAKRANIITQESDSEESVSEEMETLQITPDGSDIIEKKNKFEIISIVNYSDSSFQEENNLVTNETSTEPTKELNKTDLSEITKEESRVRKISSSDEDLVVAKKPKLDLEKSNSTVDKIANEVEVSNIQNGNIVAIDDDVTDKNGTEVSDKISILSDEITEAPKVKDVIDLDEEDICSTFVDVVNENP